MGGIYKANESDLATILQNLGVFGGSSSVPQATSNVGRVNKGRIMKRNQQPRDVSVPKIVSTDDFAALMKTVKGIGSKIDRIAVERRQLPPLVKTNKTRGRKARQRNGKPGDKVNKRQGSANQKPSATNTYAGRMSTTKTPTKIGDIGANDGSSGMADSALLGPILKTHVEEMFNDEGMCLVGYNVNVCCL